MEKNKYTVQTIEKDQERAFSVYIETKTYREKTTKEKAQHIFEYLSKHVGLLILCVSIALFFLKAYLYFYECGKLSYWGISDRYVNTFNENTMFGMLGFLRHVFVAIIFGAINAMPYWAIITGERFSTKVKQISILYFTTWIMLFLILIFVEWPIRQRLGYSLYLVLILYLTGSVLGIVRVRHERAEKAKSESSSDSPASTFKYRLILIFFTGFFSLYAGIIYGFGYWNMATEKEYRMIGDDLVVLHEGADFFLVSQCAVVEGGPQKKLHVYEAIQTEIKKTDIITITKKFDRVEKEGYPSLKEDDMQFNYNNFTCDIDVFYHEADVMIRFYDRAKEQSEEEIIDLVLVDSGYGFLCLKYKGDGGLLSGYLDKKFFFSEEMVDAAISLLEKVSPQAQNIYLPYHIDLVELTDYVEYNGEY